MNNETLPPELSAQTYPSFFPIQRTSSRMSASPNQAQGSPKADEAQAKNEAQAKKEAKAPRKRQAEEEEQAEEKTTADEALSKKEAKKQKQKEQAAEKKKADEDREKEEAAEEKRNAASAKAKQAAKAKKAADLVAERKKEKEQLQAAEAEALSKKEAKARKTAEKDAKAAKDKETMKRAAGNDSSRALQTAIDQAKQAGKAWAEAKIAADTQSIEKRKKAPIAVEPFRLSPLDAPDEAAKDAASSSSRIQESPAASEAGDQDTASLAVSCAGQSSAGTPVEPAPVVGAKDMKVMMDWFGNLKKAKQGKRNEIKDAEVKDVALRSYEEFKAMEYRTIGLGGPYEEFKAMDPKEEKEEFNLKCDLASQGKRGRGGGLQGHGHKGDPPPSPPLCPWPLPLEGEFVPVLTPGLDPNIFPPTEWKWVPAASKD